YLTSTGLTTSPIPVGERTFQIDFDFIDHVLLIRRCDGARAGFELTPMSVAQFFRSLTGELAGLEIQPRIHMYPNEVEDRIRFDRDEQHASYDAEYANRFWMALAQVARVMSEFRGRFIGKCSPEIGRASCRERV